MYVKCTRILDATLEMEMKELRERKWKYIKSSYSVYKLEYYKYQWTLSFIYYKNLFLLIFMILFLFYN